MFYKNGELKLEGYLNTDWAGSIIYERSTVRYYMFLGGTLST